MRKEKIAIACSIIAVIIILIAYAMYDNSLVVTPLEPEPVEFQVEFKSVEHAEYVIYEKLAEIVVDEFEFKSVEHAEYMVYEKIAEIMVEELECVIEDCNMILTSLIPTVA